MKQQIILILGLLLSNIVWAQTDCYNNAVPTIRQYYQEGKLSDAKQYIADMEELCEGTPTYTFKQLKEEVYGRQDYQSKLVINDNQTYKCMGVYSIDSNGDFYKEMDVNRNNFRIQYEFYAESYRRQWPLMLAQSYRILGLNLNEDKSLAVTFNNQETIDLDSKYSINKWYSVVLSYREGWLEVILDDKIIKNVQVELNPEWPEYDNMLSNCNYSSGICFEGYLRNIYVYSYD